MVYISLFLQYQRQLSLIVPDVVEGFFSEVCAAAKESGGSILQQPSGLICSFDRLSLCCAFSVFLTLDAIISSAEERKGRIREYLAFVDSSEKKISADAISERMSACGNLIFPDRAIVLTSEAKDILSPYADFEAAEGSNLFYYKGRNAESLMAASPSSLSERAAAIPFLGVEDAGQAGILSALLNGVSSISSDFDPLVFLTKKEAELFETEKRAVKRFLAFRFSKSHPVYIAEGCKNYLRLFFTALSRFYAESTGAETIEIEIPEGAFSNEELAAIEAFLSEICVFKASSPAQEGEGEIGGAAIPQDIMDAAYLFFRASEFLYAGEMDLFLAFLGKGKSFGRAVKAWFSALKFPRGQGFFSFMENLLECMFISESSKKRLDRYLFDYLHEKYRSGTILASADFCQKLSRLGIKIPDAFLAATAYRSPCPLEAAESLKSLFSFPDVPAAIESHAEAEKSLMRGNFADAQSTGKAALQAFQRRKILSGEFEGHSLLARLSFSRSYSSSGEPFSYLDYAYSCAAKMSDPDAQMRALFNLASMHFLSCNFSMARSWAERLRERASECYEKCWDFVSRFIEARIFFALGDFRACENTFAELEPLCVPLGIKGASYLCKAWIFRARSCQSKKMPVPEWPTDLYSVLPEAALFVLEGVARNIRSKGEEERTERAFLSLPAEIEDVPLEGIYIPPSEWEWRSSFAFAEDRFFCGMPSGTAYVLYSALHAFCSAFYEDSYVPARDKIFALARDKMPPASPHTYLLYYLCYELENRISGKNGPVSLSFLSRAFKSMQVLANNISDSAMHEKFFSEPHWNALLYAAARENLLI